MFLDVDAVKPVSAKLIGDVIIHYIGSLGSESFISLLRMPVGCEDDGVHRRPEGSERMQKVLQINAVMDPPRFARLHQLLEGGRKSHSDPEQV